MSRLLLAFLFLFSAVSCAYAARPLGTTDAYTVDKGHAEVECGVEYLNQTDKETGVCIAITAGILNNLDLGVEIPYTFIDFGESGKTDGFSDIAVSAKLHFIKDKTFFPDTAIGFSYQTDSANDDKYLGSGKPESTLQGIFSKSIDKFTFHLNLGYTFKDDFKEEDNEDALIYAFAVEYALSEKINLVGEITGDTVLKGEFDDNCCCGLIGLNYALNDLVTLDTGVGIGMSEASPEFSVTAGVTLAF